jgi:hypothetical protein
MTVPYCGSKNGNPSDRGHKGRDQGVIEVIGGEGRFSGAKGDGIVTGARPAQLTAGTKLYNDLTINLKK